MTSWSTKWRILNFFLFFDIWLCEIWVKIADIKFFDIWDRKWQVGAQNGGYWFFSFFNIWFCEIWVKIADIKFFHIRDQKTIWNTKWQISMFFSTFKIQNEYWNVRIFQQVRGQNGGYWIFFSFFDIWFCAIWVKMADIKCFEIRDRKWQVGTQNGGY